MIAGPEETRSGRHGEIMSPRRRRRAYAAGNRLIASSLCQVEAGLGRISSSNSGAAGVYRSRTEPTEAVPVIARNEGVPGSSPGVGFLDLQGFSARMGGISPSLRG